MLYRCLFAATLVALATLPVHADELDDLYNALFAKKVQAAKKTPVKTDDAVVAIELAAAAKEATDQIKLLTRLCDDAYELGLAHPDGHDAALAALNLIIEFVPARQADAVIKITVVLRRKYAATRQRGEKAIVAEALLDAYLNVPETQPRSPAAGEALRNATALARSIRSHRAEEIAAVFQAFNAQRLIYERIEQYRKSLKANPKNVAMAQKLIMALVVDLDSPAEAFKYTFAITDETIRSNVRLAAGPQETLTSEQSLALGEWYKTLGEKAEISSKAAMMQRSAGYLEKALEGLEPKSVAHLKAKFLLEKIQGDLAKTAQKSGDLPSGWVDVLRLMKEPSPYILSGVAGDFLVKSGNLHITRSGRSYSPLIATPVVPTGAYECRIAISFPTGRGYALIGLPVGDAVVTAYLYRSGSSGSLRLYNVNGRPASYIGINPPLNLAAPIIITVKVRPKGKQAGIQMLIGNDKKGPFWRGNIASLTPYRANQKHLKTIGMSAYSSSSYAYVIQRFQIRGATGDKLRLLKPDELAAMKKAAAAAID